MAEKRKLAFYIRLSDADEEVKAGTKDESKQYYRTEKTLVCVYQENRGICRF